jgi:hypothetical protein
MALNRQISWLLTFAVGVWIVVDPNWPSRALEAATSAGERDSDGDLLPDRLEWVLLTDPLKRDSDGDGVDDFLAAVQSRRGIALGDPLRMDHEMRVVASGNGPPGSRHVWLNLLFRFVGADLRAVTYFSPYVDSWGYRLPLSRILGHGYMTMATFQHPHEGLFVRISCALVSEGTLRSFLPCTIGAVAVVGGKLITTGSYLEDCGGRITSLVPVARDSAVFQTLFQDDADNPFWSSNRVCLLKLAVVASSPQGSLCRVTEASCVSSGRLVCPPTCVESVGRAMFFPDGLGTVTGGD